jgi:glycine/D-amino acid oxidase-like deaminating enzyme
VLGTSAYTHLLLPQVRHRFIPLYDYILVSEQLSAAQWESLGWKGRQGITDGRTFFNYYRPTADGRVLWGTSEAAYYPGNRVDPSCDHSQPHYDALRRSWRRTFPQLAGITWPYAWGGAICSTTRLTPFFGTALGGRVHYGLGYTGHGLGSTRLAGRILAHLVLDRPSELLSLSLVTKKPFPYPPEPVRGWAVAAVTRDLRRVDAGEDPSLMLRVLERMGIGFSS